MNPPHTSPPANHPPNDSLALYVLSDSSGQTAAHLARAVLAQFPGARVQLERLPRVHTVAEITARLDAIRHPRALLAYTLVLPEFREALVAEAHARSLPIVNLLEPLLSQVASLTGSQPRQEVGRLHLLDESYFKRMEAVNFAVNHDDGAGLDTLTEAEVVLVGLSRTSKTPTCLYLAQHFGLNAANVPIVAGIPPPEALLRVPRHRVVGLRVAARVLHSIRSSRAHVMGLGAGTDYTEHAAIEREVQEATRLFDALKCHVIDVSSRAVEETASEIALLCDQARQ